MIQVTNLSKKYSGDKESQVAAVNDISFSVEPGRFFTLLGPSGCGKTTTLRCIAGLEHPDDGVIFIGERVVSSPRDRIFIPPHQRNIGMVFQSYAIWPHMTVFENVAFPLRVGRDKISAAKLKDRVMTSLAMVQLEKLADRPAPKLSGGQQQRLALARALVAEPKVLLLDEPLSNLDAKLREQMRIEVRELQRRLGITTVYVTHDQSEALAMSNQIAVMRDGKIIQIGHPRDIYQSPADQFVADFIGSANFVDGKLRASTQVETAYGMLDCPPQDHLRVGDEVIISLRPENIFVHSEQPREMKNVWQGKVQVAVFLGETYDCQILVGDQIFRVRVHPSQRVRRDDPVYLHIPSESVTVMPQ